jgi:alpha-ribazole phosphatase/probable phosphoglycerate mutase
VTAEIALAADGIPIFQDKRLREYDYGDLTQAPREEVEALKMRTINEPFPNGQSLLTIVENIDQFLAEIMQDYDVRAVLIIGHSATRYALEYFCADPAKTLEEIVSTPWPWLEVPIWRYDVDEEKLTLRMNNLYQTMREK